ncbi:hypothetical protein [Streptomyces sp. NP-1717]|nr:hypothetical protein [Streptomyces sp. NP-1717]WTA75074.1 hypothetical protein OG705_20490 [Streptomyces sp. NBC_00838]
MAIDVELLQQLPEPEEAANSELGCCGFGSVLTCPAYTFDF